MNENKDILNIVFDHLNLKPFAIASIICKVSALWQKLQTELSIYRLLMHSSISIRKHY